MDPQLKELQRLQAEHPLWSCPLLRACQSGVLSREDFKLVFSQYYFYSRDFTRYLSALMANCTHDGFRARLSQNLWEEGGGADPEKRHSQIFRNFLRDAFGIERPDTTPVADCAHRFARTYLQQCMDLGEVGGCAFLAMGTEGIVSRLYSVMVEGLRAAGVAEEHLLFFHIHIACDDDHAKTLEDMLVSQRHKPGWYEQSMEAMKLALDLRLQFFNAIWEMLRQQRLAGTMDRIQARRSLAEDLSSPETLYQPATAGGTPLYSNVHEGLNIRFSVDQLPFPAEVLDVRVVKIPAGRNNERHKHAHESAFYIMQGTGKVLVDDWVMEVKAGDTVFVPRWCMHQSQNTGDTEMVILAVTDFGLTGKAFVGDYHRTARMKQTGSKVRAGTTVAAPRILQSPAE